MIKTIVENKAESKSPQGPAIFKNKHCDSIVLSSCYFSSTGSTFDGILLSSESKAGIGMTGSFVKSHFELFDGVLHLSNE